jgi:hypothetical protein
MVLRGGCGLQRVGCLTNDQLSRREPSAAGELRGVRPRQGHEYAEQIKEAAAQMERLRQDLVGSPGSNGDEKAA